MIHLHGPQSAFDSFYVILHNIFSTVYPVRMVTYGYKPRPAFYDPPNQTITA